MGELGHVHARAGHHDHDAEEHRGTDPQRGRVEALDGQSGQGRGIPHDDDERHGRAFECQDGRHQHAAIKRNHRGPSAQIPEAADVDRRPCETEDHERGKSQLHPHKTALQGEGLDSQLVVQQHPDRGEAIAGAGKQGFRTRGWRAGGRDFGPGIHLKLRNEQRRGRT